MVSLLAVSKLVLAFIVSVALPGVAISKKILKLKGILSVLLGVVIGYMLCLPAIILINFFGVGAESAILFYTALSTICVIWLKPKIPNPSKALKNPTLWAFVIMLGLSMNTVLTREFFVSRDNFAHVAYIQSMMLGRMPWDYPHAEAGHAQYYPFLSQSVKAVVGKVSSLPARVVSLVFPLFELGIFFLIIEEMQNSFNYNKTQKLALALLLAQTFFLKLFLIDIPKIMGINILLIFLMVLLKNHAKKAKLWVAAFPLAALSIVTSKFFAMGFALFSLYTVAKRKKGWLKTLAFTTCFAIAFSSPWWLPIYKTYGFQIKNKEGAFVNQTLGFFLKESKEPFSLLLMLAGVGLMLKSNNKNKKMFGIFLIFVIAWLYHWVLSMPLLNISLGSSFAMSFLQTISPFLMLETLSSITKKTMMPAAVMAFLIAIPYFPRLAPPDPMGLVKQNTPFGKGLFTQQKDNLEVYDWIEKNTDEEDVFLNIEELYQRQMTAKLTKKVLIDVVYPYLPNALLVSSFTGRRVAVVNHNYFNIYLDRLRETYIVNFIYGQTSKEEKCKFIKDYNISYIVVNEELQSKKYYLNVTIIDNKIFYLDAEPELENSSAPRGVFEVQFFKKEGLDSLKAFPKAFKNNKYIIYKAVC